MNLTLINKGKRTDLIRGHEIYQGAKPGTGLRRLAEEEPLLFIKYHKGFAALEGILSRPRRRDEARQTIVLIGDTGKGKTKWVFDRYEASGLWVSAVGARKDAIWFDGYHGDACAVIDDFRGAIAYEDILKLTDPWINHRVPVKGGFTIWQPDVVIITSNLDPVMWWPSETPTSLEPLHRRIKIYSIPQDLARLRLDFPEQGASPPSSPGVESALRADPTLQDVIIDMPSNDFIEMNEDG